MTTPKLPTRTAAENPSDGWRRLPGLVLVVRADGEQIYASPALTACTSAHTNQPVLDTLTPQARRSLTGLMQTRKDFQLEVECAEAPGPSFAACVLSCSAKWMPDIDAHLCVMVDVTMAHQEKRHAVSRSQFLQDFCNALPIMMAYYDFSMECLYANRHYAQLYGLTESSILGMHVSDVVGDVDLQVRPLREQAYREGRTAYFEREFVRADGPHWVRGIVQPLMDAQGRRVGGASLNQDVTARHVAEQALEASEARLARFVEASDEGVLFHVDGVITDVNPAACRIYGADQQALLWHSVLEFIAPEEVEAARSAIAKPVDSRLESTIVTPQGERIAVEVTGRTMLRNGERLRMVILRDIRDRRQAQARIDELIAGLRAEKDRAEAADRAKSVFLAAASHDLRQPLHALGLFLTALRSMAHNPVRATHELADIGQRMQSSLDSLGQLLNMLLDVSRLDANAVQIEREPTSLAPMLHDLGQDFSALAHEKKLRLRIAPTRLWVDTDPTVLRRILTNLLSNAVRYTPRGRILLGCRRRGNEVEIQVWDSGIGIAPEQREAIFEEFYQVGQSAAQDHEAHGLGLGLSIVQRSARLLHAPLNLRSQPGRGSMFSIRLPLCQAPAQRPVLEPAERRTPIGLGVLVIDDDHQVLGAMQRVLGIWGHRVFCASSADEAVVAAITHADHIHLLLSDYRLSGNVTAVDAISAVHACLPKPIPTYILTGDTSPQRIHEASLLGFPLLHKPVNATTLRNILDREAIAHATLA